MDPGPSTAGPAVADPETAAPLSWPPPEAYVDVDAVKRESQAYATHGNNEAAMAAMAATMRRVRGMREEDRRANTLKTYRKCWHLRKVTTIGMPCKFGPTLTSYRSDADVAIFLTASLCESGRCSSSSKRSSSACASFHVPSSQAQQRRPGGGIRIANGRLSAAR